MHIFLIKMAYHQFKNYINSEEIKIIFELGSRDLEDGVILINTYNNSICHSFECNPDCLIECEKKIKSLDIKTRERIHLIDKAVSISNSKVTFFPFDLNKYNNMGSSSMYEIDFTKRDKYDPDYNRGNVQKKIEVDGIRLDSYMQENNIENIDLLCMDLQGYELNALKSLGDKLKTVKYIISECSINSTYKGGCNFIELYHYLKRYNFVHVKNTNSGENLAIASKNKFCEFDSLFKNTFLKC